MNLAIRYYTRSGNTEKLAKAISQKLALPAETIDAPLAEKADILLLGCSYYAFDMDKAVKSFLQSNREKIGAIACFGTSAMMKSMKKPLKKATEELGIVLLEDEFHCRGAFGPFHKGKPDEEDLKAVQSFAAKVEACSKNIEIPSKNC